MEGLHTVLMVASSSTQSNDQEDWEMLLNLTRDKSNLVSSIRQNYLEKSQGLSFELRSFLLQMTNLYQRIIWLLHNWAREAVL